MKNSVFRFTLNHHIHRSQVSVPVFLGDTAVQLYISLTDGGNTYYIEDGCTAVLRGKKPDGKTLLEYCLIENNTRIRYDFNEQTTSCEGIVNCEISLYGADGNLLTCPKFIIVVGDRVVGDTEIIESESERSALDAIFASEAERKNAEKARADAETARAEAERARANSFESIFVRYSAHPDGTDFTENRADGQNYMGIATSHEAPTDPAEYEWIRIVYEIGDIDTALDAILAIQNSLIGGASE